VPKEEVNKMSYAEAIIRVPIIFVDIHNPSL
jgi:hypothetical protein